MQTSNNGCLTIKLLKDVDLISSNRVPISAEEFTAKAYHFKKGTLFINYGTAQQNKEEDPDCVENDNMHGWCYRDSKHPYAVNYCNFHAWILDYWPQRPDLFEEVDVKS